MTMLANEFHDVESAGRQIPIAFLERIKEDFSRRYGGGKAATATAKSLNREFKSKLKEHMKYCVEHPEEISKLAKVKAQVSEVNGVMMENIEKETIRDAMEDSIMFNLKKLTYEERKAKLIEQLHTLNAAAGADSEEED
ncbi:hypothetical protein J1N35_019428 [Gossypium stocksii]|uniref:Longin domain-containing protein n=1 Tax=Gossypium stocksii TaxID=47602 RepID=A0A9D4A887_9ROSI|nr:hypothetical protein J1N35_019428 [Gossypium stocksii]